MKKPFRFPALVLAICLLLSLSAFASGEPSAPPGGGSSEPESYDAVLDITSDMTLDGVAMSSEAGDQNVIHVYGGASALVANSTFKNGGTGSSGDASSFYGVGATLFVSDGSLYVNNVSIDSQTAGGAGVFAYLRPFM